MHLFVFNKKETGQEFQNQSLRFYSENTIQSNANIYSAVKNGSLNQIEDFAKYKKWIEVSYTHHIVSQTQFENLPRNDAFASFNLEEWQTRLEGQMTALERKEMTLNSDMKIMQFSNASASYTNIGYLGLYNSPYFLQLQYILVCCEVQLSLVVQNKDPEGLSKLNLLVERGSAILN